MFAKHGDTFDRIGVNPNDGLADVLTRVAALPDAERAADRGRRSPPRWRPGPPLAMVDSDRGITNLHVPSDIIIDASMPPMIRDSGKMWNAAGELQDTMAVIPDSSYAGVYDAVVDDCRPTARSTRPRWARCPTSGSWRRRPRSTARTTRPSRSPSTAPCGS